MCNGIMYTCRHSGAAVTDTLRLNASAIVHQALVLPDAKLLCVSVVCEATVHAHGTAWTSTELRFLLNAVA